MEQNISMIRFLMFMILALIIFFNIAPQLVGENENVSEGDKNGDDDEEEQQNSSENDKTEDSESQDASGGKYCLIGGETEKGKVCKEISPSDSCQNKFASLKECKEWKSALEHEKDVSSNYLYTTDDIDKKTIMTSDDMIFCLKNDKTCEKMKFGDCHNIHIGTYLSEDNCNEANKNREQSGDNSTSQ